MVATILVACTWLFCKCWKPGSSLDINTDLVCRLTGHQVCLAAGRILQHRTMPWTFQKGNTRRTGLGFRVNGCWIWLYYPGVGRLICNWCCPLKTQPNYVIYIVNAYFNGRLTAVKFKVVGKLTSSTLFEMAFIYDIGRDHLIRAKITKIKKILYDTK